ncbi:zinc-binding alcohol dehydrogenase [Stappia sp. ES.058]|uniref:zinc-dependent alcohol dehydrogenase n=1 Tax=Stappia sp. ES.058 TaxID=1881061 RepID=UPI00087C8442|nr:zinc-binding alcohol dehydrogenase [Stappia sp. ES.058]SDU48967.1 2-desacetyl-2-hydroxyethyl bacteriochlorophyllide A dehydrogenase [Stappia sp. ES.058]
MTHRTITKKFPCETQALWSIETGRMALRSETVSAPGTDEVCVRTRFSGVSPGTERLVLSGKVPESEWNRMRAPFQEGDFPFPVKYGYASVGEIIAGAPDRLGETVFVLHPHQSLYTVPADAAVPLPADVPAARGILAANMETALNGLWDGGASPGDHIAVVGGGIVGLLVAHLAAGIPGTRVTVIDTDPSREAPATSLGAGFATPDAAPEDQDLVYHASGHPDGLDTALSLAGTEARVVEMSWYGTAPVTATLGGAFHSRRLTLRSSQVGRIPPERQPRWTYRRRLEAALSLLREPALDALISPPVALTEAATRIPALLGPEGDGRMPLISYDTPAHTD